MTPGRNDEVERLAALLDATHAALYGYGVLGARLDPDARRAAQAAATAHRSRRDSLSALLRDRGAVPPAPAAAYDVAASGRADALALAVRLEEGLAVRWRDLVAGTDDEQLRRVAVDGLSDVAVRAATWRVLLGGPATVAFPGT